MPKLRVALVFLVAAATTGWAEWTIQSAQTEGARDGVEHRHVVLTDPEASSTIGLLIVDGRTIAPLQRARLVTGVLAASARGVQIMRTREFSRKQKLNAAVQCGPFLVDLDRPVRGLEGVREARRTFAAIAKSDRAALGFCTAVSLADLAKILATVQIADGFKISRALNLDGGSSSAFWVRRETGKAFSIPEQKTVRDFVAVVPRGSGD